jgi:lysophospholipid acyltransferase (LPLAT)-like uncharacterized protein
MRTRYRDLVSWQRLTTWLMPVAIRLAAWLLLGLFWTLRPIYIGEPMLRRLLDSQTALIPAFWHGRLLYPLRLKQIYRLRRVTVLVSRSRDGEWISQIARRFGVLPTRGSSHRGGAQGLLEMVRRVQEGYIACVTPDGPRGPRYRVQPGVVTLAHKTGAVILPITYNAKWRKVMHSWDGFVLPMPFSRIVVIYGEPICVPAYMTTDGHLAARREVECRLQQITEMADRFF